jgi:hypothetical protein
MRHFLLGLIGRLSVGRKLILIYALDLSAVIFISTILINEKFIAIDFARKEIVGNAYIAAVRAATLGVLGRRGSSRGGRDTGRRGALRHGTRRSRQPHAGAGAGPTARQRTRPAWPGAQTTAIPWLWRCRR